jgi:hypothetical protein
MWTRPALILFIGGFVAYAVVLFATIAASNHGIVPASLRVPVALLPVVPLVFVGLGVLRAVRAGDELQLRMQYEAIAFAFTLTAFTTFSYGFLETYAGFPHLNMFAVWPAMAVFWIVGKLVGRFRYA